MKNVLIIGSTGQIGSELTMKLRSIYNGNIVAGYIPGAEPKGELKESGPSAIVDITNEQQIAETVSKYNIDTIYNLAALLSAVAEAKPQLAWKIGMGGLFNVLEVAREMGCAVFTPSSIGVFGNNTPKDKTPQDTIRNPRTMYGVTKVSGELLSDYYHIRFGVDTRSVRFPGLISYVTPPGGGTTDYAVDIYYSAVKGEKFECPIAAGTFMDMMYMPDGLRAAIEIMEANPDKLIHRNSFNIASMSFDPEIIYNNIKKYMPDFHMEYKVDPLRQAIAESWPNSLDDTCAREEWGWKPEYDLDTMTKDMLAKLKERLDRGEDLPQYIKDHPIYYAGPAKTPEGMACGSMGPTTAGRMDPYVDLFQEHGGSMIMLAKGNRSQQVTDACKKHGGFYLGSIGGPAAILAQNNIKSIECVEYPELGMEAIWKIEVEDFPAFILVDDKGNDFFKQLKPRCLGNCK